MKILGLNRSGLLIAVALSVIVVLQARYIRTLQANEEELAAKGAVKDGIPVPDIDAFDSSGKQVLVPYSAVSHPTIIYVFRPSCPWCGSNSKAVNWLQSQVSNRYRLVGLSLSKDGLTEFLKMHPMNFSVYHDPSPSLVASLHLATTPETIVVSPAGRVLAAWNGAYIGSTQSDIERFVSVSFPPGLIVVGGS